MSDDLESPRKTRGAQDYSDLGKDIHLRVCTHIVIYCFFELPSSKEGEKKVTKIAHPGVPSFSLSSLDF